VLTASPTAIPVTSLPTASTMPAASYPGPPGTSTGATYLSLRHIDSARLRPIALTLMRTSAGPGAATSLLTNSRTSGPPAFANLTVREARIRTAAGARHANPYIAGGPFGRVTAIARWKAGLAAMRSRNASTFG